MMGHQSDKVPSDEPIELQDHNTNGDVNWVTNSGCVSPV